MKRHSDSEAQTINYLLGALPDEESELFERRYLEDEVLFEELQEIEDELIDDYVTDALSGEQRARFEEYFLLSPQRREKLEFARAMTEHAVAWKNRREANGSSATIEPGVAASGLEAKPAGKLLSFERWLRPAPVWRQWAAIAAALLVAVGGGFLWLRNRELRSELLAAASKEARLRQEAESQSAAAEKLQAEISVKEQEKQALGEEIERLRNSFAEAPGKVTVNILLALRDLVVNRTRGGPEPPVKTLKIPADAQTLRLNVEVNSDKYRMFQVALQSDDRNPVWSRRSVKPKAKRQNIVLNIPASRLRSGDYNLVLSGTTAEGNSEMVGRYYLKVERR